jgi:hypothetical protein
MGYTINLNKKKTFSIIQNIENNSAENCMHMVKKIPTQCTRNE